MAYKRKRSYRKKSSRRPYKKRRTIKKRRKSTRMSNGISGFGSYKVNVNTMMPGGSHPMTIYNATKEGGVIIRHREYVGEVIPTSAFTVQYNLPIQPGQKISFPWLSGVAENFEEYEWRGMAYYYESTSSDAILNTAGAGSTSLGSVNMTTQYNVLNQPFQTLTEMLNYDFGNSCKPSVSGTHYVECARGLTNQSKLWVRPTNTTGNEAFGDRRLYDLGDFNLATEGCQGTSGNIGKLWCTYEVELKKPKLLLADESNSIVAYWPTNARVTGVTTTIDLLNPAEGLFLDAAIITADSSWRPAFFLTDNGEWAIRFNYESGGNTYANVVNGDKVMVECMIYGDAADDGSFLSPVTYGMSLTSAPGVAQGALIAGSGTRYHLSRHTYTIDYPQIARIELGYTTVAAQTVGVDGLLSVRKMTTL